MSVAAARLAAMGLLWLPVHAGAATFSASLDRSTVTVGETVTLSLAFNGGQPDDVPSPPEIRNLQIAYIGPSSQFSFINGQVSSSVTHNFRVTPLQSGDYTIPPLTAQVGGEKLTTQPITLKVLKANAPPPEAIESGSQAAFIKLVLPKNELYVGETMVGELQLYISGRAQGIGQFQMPGIPAEGLNPGKMVEGQRRRVQVGNAVYVLIPFSMPIRATRAGPAKLGPVNGSIVVEFPGRRRRDPFFEQFGIRDPFDAFGGAAGEQKQAALTAEALEVRCLELPRENIPPSFNGAIGSYTMSATAGPTNVAVGDPITLKVTISGRGTLDSLSLPDQTGWKGFKVYPPTSKLDTTDPFGLQGSKSFEEVVVAETPEVKALPPISFSYFDPEHRGYRTLTQPSVALVVRPGGVAPTPSYAVGSRSGQENAPPAQDIVHIKQRPGALAQAGQPLIVQPWFVAVQSVPLVAFLSAVAWRKRSDLLANNPRLRRRRQVAALVHEGLQDLRRQATENNSDAFFATLFRLLQEQLGERLDVPATAITEAVIEERLRLRGVPESVLMPLQELFNACNLARYAPVKDSRELAGLIPKVEAVLKGLSDLRV